jgi:hypothetical protein
MLLVQLPLSAHADSTDIDHCKRIENDTQRLACYDELFQRTAADKVENTDTEPTTQESPEASSGLQGESATVAEFGAEQVEKPPVTFIEARLVGNFNGWTGKTIFTLDNGQVWQQTNNYIRDYKPRSPIPQAEVTISKGMIGSYNMQVEGVKRIVQVKRVK